MLNHGRTKIVIVGMGGVGSILLPLITKHMSYVCTPEQRDEFLFVDGDHYEENNLERQYFAPELVGMNKAEAQRLVYHNRYPNMEFLYLPEFLTSENIHKIIDRRMFNTTIILSCVDNHPCRLLLSKLVQANINTENLILISGGNEETDGNVNAFGVMNKYLIGMPLEDRHPEIAEDKEDNRENMSCQELYAIEGGTQLMVANANTATLMYTMFFSLTRDTDLSEQSNILDIYFDAKICGYRTVYGKPFTQMAKGAK